MILINVKFPIRPDRIDDWLPVARQYAKDVSAEPGNVYFEWYRDIDEAFTFIGVECFTDADAGGAHTRTEHFKRFVEVAPDLVAARPDIVYADSPAISGWAPMSEITPR
jgi:quinol monooxygenase YgiN